MRITEKGQVTIPNAIRRKAGLLPGTEVEFVHDENGVHIRRVSKSRTARDREIEDTLNRLRGSATIRMSTEEILALTRGE